MKITIPLKVLAATTAGDLLIAGMLFGFLMGRGASMPVAILLCAIAAVMVMSGVKGLRLMVERP